MLPINHFHFNFTPSLVFSSTNDTNSGDRLLIMHRRLL